jgi:hypothetical protein
MVTPKPKKKPSPKKTTEQRLGDLEKSVNDLLSTNIDMLKMISDSHSDIITLKDVIDKLKKKT